MDFIFPYRFNQVIMLTWKRIQTKVIGFEGSIDDNGELDDYFIIETEYGRVSLKDIKTEPSKNVYSISPKYKIGSEVLYHDDNPYANHIIQRGKINKISFTIANYGNIFNYGIKSRNLTSNVIYKDVTDFKSRTKPKRILREGERYIFRNYSIQQKYLEPIKVEKHTKTHSTYRGEKIRNTNLYTSIDKFHNRMLAQVI